MKGHFPQMVLWFKIPLERNNKLYWLLSYEFSQGKRNLTATKQKN